MVTEDLFLGSDSWWKCPLNGVILFNLILKELQLKIPVKKKNQTVLKINNIWLNKYTDLKHMGKNEC